MSNYWSMHCKTCNVESDTNINHGDHILRGMAKAYPHLKAAQQADESGYLEFHVMSYGAELFSFLQEHDGHEIDLVDECGKFEPIIIEAFDRNYDDWKPGDQIAWEEEKTREAPLTLLRIDEYERVFWLEDGKECMTRATNMLRITGKGIA